MTKRTHARLVNVLYKQMMSDLLSSVSVTEQAADYALVKTTKTSLEHRLTDNKFRFWFVGIRSLNEIHSRRAEAIALGNHMDCMAYSALLLTATQIPSSISLVSESVSHQMARKLADSLSKGRHGWWNQSVCSVEQLVDMRHTSLINGSNIDILNFTAMIAARTAVDGLHSVTQ